jgi:hypothetical protein
VNSSMAVRANGNNFLINQGEGWFVEQARMYGVRRGDEDGLPSPPTSITTGTRTCFTRRVTSLSRLSTRVLPSRKSGGFASCIRSIDTRLLGSDTAAASRTSWRRRPTFG